MIRLSLALSLLLFACTTSDADDGARTPLGKADNFGSCEDACGGPSDGSCWCDELCADNGDCCADYEAICTGDDAACHTLGSEDCDLRDDCDTVTMSGFPGDLTFCVSIVDDCEALDAFSCDLRDDCTSITGDGFPGSITICTSVEEDCPAQSAVGAGACEQLLGYRWNGEACEPLSGCSCKGSDCENLQATIEDCDAAAAVCDFGCELSGAFVLCAPGTVWSDESCACEPIPQSCEDVGGTCRSSPIDVTFAADCEADFGESPAPDATCPAFNQSCCLPN